MKKLAFILFLVGFYSIAQTDGLSYQAVIIDPEIQEIPGVDISGNVLNEQDIEVRFTIINDTGSAQYRETQGTRTDAFGMIHLIIGRGEVDFGNFKTIVWDGTAKQLKVEVNLGNGYKFQEEKELLYVPYALHRDLIVTKELEVGGDVTFQGNLEVEGKTNLNNDLSVNNQTETRLSGLLSVDGQTVLGDSLTVANQSPTGLRGTLTVSKETLLKDSLTVRRRTRLKATLDVEERTNIGNGLNVENGSPTVLTGTLGVDGETNILNDVNVNNGSNVQVSGDMLVEGATTLEQDLTVNGSTNLNNTLNVNNQVPTSMTGTLITQGATRIDNTLVVSGTSNLDGNLNVNGQNPTQLSGTLTVGEETNFNDDLFVNNAAPTDLSGDLTVGGEALFNNDVTIDGVTNLNNDLFVNNASPTNLSGTLTVTEEVNLNDTLDVIGATTLNSDLEVLNGSATVLSGATTVDGTTLLENTLTVANQSASTLDGTLAVTGVTDLNSDLNVTGGNPSTLTGTLDVSLRTELNDNLSVLNGSATTLNGALRVFLGSDFNSTFRVNNGATTNFTGTLQVDQPATLLNSLTITNASPTDLTGALTVGGASTLNDTFSISGFSLIDNSLTVTQNANLASISATALTVQSDQNESVTTFENENEGNTAADSGDGILIKLGRTHGAYNGPAGTNNPSDYLNIAPPTSTTLQPALNSVKDWVRDGGTFNPADLISLVPSNIAAGAMASINQGVVDRINAAIGLPFDFPDVSTPAYVISNEVTIFSGTNELCTGQYCFNPCTFFDCTVCIPPIAFCVPGIPRIYIPEIGIPSVSVSDAVNDLFSALVSAQFPGTGNLDSEVLQIPNFTFSTVSNSMSKENVFMAFQDKDGRQTGAIRAQSTADFADNTIFDDVYAIGVLSNFINIDLVETLAAGLTSVSNLVDEFNDLGVEYMSGNGDYAEWLPRENVDEYITAGDIVAIRGGKISKELTNFEQVLVVSHKPIVLGNAPEKNQMPTGNVVAFMGQVPVKVMGPVSQGDYIVADNKMKGYGLAIAEEDMNPENFRHAVGRSWETNRNQGPKVVKIVMGMHTNSWTNQVQQVQNDQDRLDAKIESIEEKLIRISKRLNQVDTKEVSYAQEK